MRKKQFRLNLKETFERRIRTPEPFYNNHGEKREDLVSTQNDVENKIGEVKGSPQQLQHISRDAKSSLTIQEDVQKEYNLGDTVRISGQEAGVIRYLGNVHFQVKLYNDKHNLLSKFSFSFQPGIWAGVELFNPVGLHGGLVDNIEYFCCQPRHGVFAPLWTIELAQDQDFMDQTHVDLPLRQR